MTVGWDFVQNSSCFVSAAEVPLSFDFFWQYQYVVSLKPARWVWSWRESWSSLGVCLLSVIQRGVCCEPPAAFFTSERRLTDLQNSVCGMFPKCKNLLHVTFKRQLHIIVLEYHCDHWSLGQRNSKHVSLLSWWVCITRMYITHIFRLGIQTST